MTGARNDRVWLGGAAVLALLVVVVGWFFLVSPQRTETADVESRTADAQTQNLTLQGRIGELSTQSKNRDKYAAALDAARRALPAGNDLSSFLRVAQSIAAASSTHITSLNVGDPAAFTPDAAAVAAPTTPSAPVAPASSTAPGGAASTGDPAVAGLFEIPIDASVVGRATDLSAFLTRLQSRQPRAVLLTSVTRSSTTDGGAVLQLRMKVFVASATARTMPTTGSMTTTGTGGS